MRAENKEKNSDKVSKIRMYLFPKKKNMPKANQNEHELLKKKKTHSKHKSIMINLYD